MAHENHHHHHRSSSSPRSATFPTTLRRSNSCGLLSRVLGSFRNKHHDEKGKKTAEQAGEDRRDWIANYKGTHHPDRPRVDKRTQEMVSDEEYAAQIRRMQERSQRYYELSSHGRTPKSPVPNFSYSSMSPRSNRMSSVSPTFDKISCTFHDRIPSRATAVTDPVVASPVSPSDRTIQIYRSSGLDRGPIIRYSEDSKRGGSPPRTTSFTKQPVKRRSSDGAVLRSLRRTETSAKLRIDKPLDQETKPLVFNDSTDELSPSLILNSSPTLPSRPYAAPTSASTAAFPSPIRTCPWRGCHAILATTQEKIDNICKTCHEALYPRASAFFGSSPYSHSPPSVKDTHLETLRVLIGTKSTNADDEDSRARSEGIRTQPTNLDKRYSIGSFKLLPAPRGKRRQIAEARKRLSDEESEKESGNESAGSAWSTSSFSHEHHRRRHPAPTLGPRGTGPDFPHYEGIFGASPRSARPLLDKDNRDDGNSMHVNTDKEEEEEEEEEEAQAAADPPSDHSWTTDSRSSRASWTSGGPTSPVSAADGDAKRELFPPPLIARVQSGEQAFPEPALRRSGGYHATRDTLLYREIEDIIDCYADVNAGIGDAPGRQRRKAGAVASFLGDEPLTAKMMRRRGFI
ncbi:hypothetical protein F5Y11DRAFT_223891 [Daldinia sp. FL1419]|nr:hypothetical protein F5Y11DRAFT_223891 [Daldinia sp. FL1419]